MQALFPLRNPIREYAWGSMSAIADLLGRPPTSTPQAELWLGAHPSSPSEVWVEGDGGGMWRRLDRWIAEDPQRVLGHHVTEHWGYLPFLLKVLAAAKPLSIQAHPDAEQARRGFEAEEAAGMARDAAERNYPDPRHKPELIYALTEFTVLRGFREPADVLRRLERLGLGSEPYAGALTEHAGERGKALEGFLHSLLRRPADDAARAVRLALDAIETQGPHDEAEAWLPRLAAEYGLDRGVLGPLFLHVFRLEPGEALFTGAGVLHAYLEGVGVEVMASSDNVLRGGLTQKHVDPDELAKVVVYEPLVPSCTPGTRHGGRLRFDTPADDFRLSVLRPEGGVVAVEAGVQILLCTEGDGEIRIGGTSTPFRRGDSFLVPHAAGGYEVAGRSTVFRASVGARSEP